MRRVGLWAIVGTLGLALIGALVGFLWLPQSQDPAANAFAAWCSALGVPRKWLSSAGAIAPGPQTSKVLLTHDLLGESSAADVGLGATLALRCTICHGPTGISYADSPNLAGQYAAVVYKQLKDYESGARDNPIMTPMARSLSDIEMRRLAAYYGSLPRPPAAVIVAKAPDIVRWGSPMRNIAPCGSCHGDIDHTMASPWLKGEPKNYLRAQLSAFASGARTNDINGQMRAMAQSLTPEEIEAAAHYYAGDAR
jgi:cytochrome c553